MYLDDGEVMLVFTEYLLQENGIGKKVSCEQRVCLLIKNLQVCFFLHMFEDMMQIVGLKCDCVALC